MRVLIIGNLGYIGPVAQRVFLQKSPAVQLRGFDSGFFAHCLTTNESSLEWMLGEQIYGDVRTPPAKLLDDVAAAIANGSKPVNSLAVVIGDLRDGATSH